MDLTLTLCTDYRTTSITSRRYSICLYSDEKLKLRHCTLMVMDFFPNSLLIKLYRGITSNLYVLNSGVTLRIGS